MLAVDKKLILVAQLRTHAQALRIRACSSLDQRMQDALLKTANTCESKADILESNYRLKLKIDPVAPLDLEIF